MRSQTSYSIRRFPNSKTLFRRSNFNQALFQLVKDGKVSEKEALAKATNAQALEMNFKGIFLDEGRRILG